MFKNLKRKKLWAIAAFVVVIAFIPVVIDLFSDPYELGIKAMKADDYKSAKYWMLKVPEKHPKYDEVVGLLDEERGQIGAAMAIEGRLQMHKEIEKEAAANQERIDKKLTASITLAQYSCKTAAVKAAKWEGSESDFINKSEVTQVGEDSLRVVGKDVKFVNGFGAKSYAEYVGVYSMKAEKCRILQIGD
jgi:hypothetical protein